MLFGGGSPPPSPTKCKMSEKQNAFFCPRSSFHTLDERVCAVVMCVPNHTCLGVLDEWLDLDSFLSVRGR